ncbi:hypothetical protein DL93DRAFT_1812144 [Clavulina sp. PMI_390]|nr:hypothetical protein DL93DRAFT_1812144 [Clavulina sp. PMI_390]
MPDPDPTLLSHEGAPIRIWLHPGIEHRQSLERLIDAYGGLAEESPKSSQMALVDTSPSTFLSEKTYTDLVLESISVVDPSWLLDSIEKGDPLADDAYSIVHMPDSTFAHMLLATPDEDPGKTYRLVERYKEAAEIFFKTVLDLGTRNWDVVYKACAKSPKVRFSLHNSQCCSTENSHCRVQITIEIFGGF